MERSTIQVSERQVSRAVLEGRFAIVWWIISTLEENALDAQCERNQLQREIDATKAQPPTDQVVAVANAAAEAPKAPQASVEQSDCWDAVALGAIRAGNADAAMAALSKATAPKAPQSPPTLDDERRSLRKNLSALRGEVLADSSLSTREKAEVLHTMTLTHEVLSRLG